MELAQQMLNLRDGDHLCLFYDKDPTEQMPALVPFIHDALTKDERFVYLADDQTVDELVACLERDGVDVGKQIGRGALKLWTSQEWRQSGRLSSGNRAAQMLDLVRTAADAGFKGV